MKITKNPLFKIINITFNDGCYIGVIDNGRWFKLSILDVLTNIDTAIEQLKKEYPSVTFVDNIIRFNDEDLLEFRMIIS